MLSLWESGFPEPLLGGQSSKAGGFIALGTAVPTPVSPSERMRTETSHGESYGVESRSSPMPVFSRSLGSAVYMVLRGPSLHGVLTPGKLIRGTVSRVLLGLVVWA